MRTWCKALTLVMLVAAAVSQTTIPSARDAGLAIKSCEGVISDEAELFSDRAVVLNGAKSLIDQGADVKVVTVPRLSDYGSNLNAVESRYEAACSSWLSPAGKRKANLFVLMVAPNDRKKNVFFGSAYTGALPNEDTVNLIYSRAANPYFGNKQWEQGFVSALKDFSAKIAAYHDQQQHPVSSTTTINQQATDLSWLGSFLMWCLWIGVGVFVVVWIYIIVSRRGKRDEVKQQAQATALDEWQRTTSAFTRMPDDHPQKVQISQQFSDMSNSVKFDPNQEMSAAEYVVAARAWRELRLQILGPDHVSQVRSEPIRERRPRPRTVPEPVRQPPSQSSVVVNNTTRGSDGFVEGMLMDEVLRGGQEREREREPERSYRAPDPEPESSSSGSDSSWSDSFGGGGSDSGFGGDSGGGSGSDSGF